jgi:hypothetical protein
MATPNRTTSGRRWSENPTNSTMDLHAAFVGVMELSMDEEAAGLASVAPRARASSGFSRRRFHHPWLATKSAGLCTTKPNSFPMAGVLCPCRV